MKKNGPSSAQCPPLGDHRGPDHRGLLSRFLTQTHFESQDDFIRNLHFKIPERFNFAYDVMDVWAEEQPDKLALLWTNDEGEYRRFTFGELKTLTDRTAAWFMQLGIGRGDKVMLILKRRYEFWLSMLALHKIGAIAIPATHMLTRHDIVYRNTRAGVKAIVCVGEEYVMRQVSEAMPDSPTVETLISVGPLRAEGFHDWQSEWEQAPAFVRPDYVNDNDDTMLMYFTSGTSGEPKMVAHDFLYALGHLTTGVFWHNLSADSIHLTVADTGWGKAVWGKMYGQWFAGAVVFVFDHEKFTADKLLRQIERYRITSFCAPPTVYRFMIHEDFSKYDLSSLRYCCTAGEALNPAVYDRFLELTGIRLMEGFGQTETTMTLGTMPWTTPKPGSMGLPNPQYDIALVKPDGTPCEDGEKGEIVIKTSQSSEGRVKRYDYSQALNMEQGNIGQSEDGYHTSEPNTHFPELPKSNHTSSLYTHTSDLKKPLGLFKEYYRDEELTRRVWHDGMYHTGDVAWRDEDGYYWFVGRIDDVIKSSGYRIGPFEVESALMTHPAVVECAITGVPDDIRGMVVKATVVLHADWKDRAGDDLVKELQQHVKRETAPYKYPRIIEFVDELPKTISGKIRRVEIREKDKK
ncbi:MAG: AMP-binding protein [Prevotella sp.]|nr:AMP-binding protein [Prevotella sp.]